MWCSQEDEGLSLRYFELRDVMKMRDHYFVKEKLAAFQTLPLHWLKIKTSRSISIPQRTSKSPPDAVEGGNYFKPLFPGIFACNSKPQCTSILHFTHS